jgi:hypothetical protein
VFRETRTPSDRHYLDFAYVAEVSKDVFRLSEYRHREFYDEDRFHWASGIELEIIDGEGRSLWTCPPNPAVRDLFEIVVEATTDIDGVMARLDSFAKAS